MRYLFLCLFLLVQIAAKAQNELPNTKFGVQFRPLFASGLAVRSTPSITSGVVTFDATAQNGFILGMNIRRNFNKRFCIETGINLSSRNYTITMQRSDNGFLGKIPLKVASYEIPVSGIFYVRISEKIYINTALGVSFDVFPSELTQRNEYATNLILRSLRFMPAGIINLGAEYRTAQKGYYYLGASYHRPVFNTYSASLQYNLNTVAAATQNFALYGDYLSLDLRYFFAK